MAQERKPVPSLAVSVSLLHPLAHSPTYVKMKNYEFLICKYVSHHLVGPCHETQQDSEKELEGSFRYNYHFLLWHKCQMSV